MLFYPLFSTYFFMSKDTILIVDDERFFCSLLQDILKDDYQTIIVNDSKKTIETLSCHPIDLILLDIIMPDSNGYEICKSIKSNNLYSDLPVIFLSAKNETEDEIRGFNLGAVDYITKPISPPIVKARIATHLALAKATKKLQQHTLELELQVSQRTEKLTMEIAEKQKTHEKLHHLANYDQLTRLPNRNLFNERLAYSYEQAKRNNCSFSLLLIDLDRFKFVNDSLGHHIGDLVLEQVAQRLSGCIRAVDTVARLGGDEFTVTLNELKQKGDAAIVAEKIISDISQPFEIHGQIIHIGCSIGISTFSNDGESLHDMLKNADMAMYDVKERGKNAYAFFSSEMTKHENHRIEVEEDLYKALANNELYLHYQPIINLKTESICAVEALLRWKHPKHGQVAADKIISIAEDSCLIIKLGEWILNEGCRQLSLWHSQGYTSLNLAINISARQFDRKYDSVTLISKLFDQYQLPKHSLHLEITENLMQKDSNFILETLSDLKKIGILLSIDDFGTGYSSLSFLRKFPIDILKIDHSFLRNLRSESRNDTLVKAIIAMAQSLNLKVIAEGVESEDQLEFLQKHGCDQAQGNYFSQPVSADEIGEFLRAGSRLKAKD
jgi:diguanylate cyclase (GGDEF)-like protein